MSQRESICRGQLIPAIPARSVENDFPNLSTHYTVKQIVVPACDDESHERMAIVQSSGSLDFWMDPSEDIYSADDTDPI